MASAGSTPLVRALALRTLREPRYAEAPVGEWVIDCEEPEDFLARLRTLVP